MEFSKAFFIVSYSFVREKMAVQAIGIFARLKKKKKKAGSLGPKSQYE